MADISTPSMLTSSPMENNTYLYKDLDLPQRIILAIILISIGISGIIGNSIVILAIILSRKLRSTLNWFVLNLACADLLTSLFAFFHVVDVVGQMGWVKLNWFQLGWPYTGWFYVNTTCVGTSLTTHAFIGFTSWYLITRSQDKFEKLYKSRNIALMVAFSWVFNFSSLCIIGQLEKERDIVAVIASWIFVHFAVVITVYVKLWRFIARSGRKLKENKKTGDKTLKSVDENNISNDTKNAQERENFASGIVLRVSESSENLASRECGAANGKRINESSADRNETEVHVCVDKSASKQPPKKPLEPKIDKKVLSVTKNLFVILIAFVICFIPYAVCLCSKKSYSALPWLLALLLLNSCINPIIYARRIRVFREVMLCIIRCQLGSIPMPIEFVRNIRPTN